MIEWLKPLAVSVLLMVFQMLMHEGGHYLVAYRLNWKPHLTVVKYWGWMPAFAVKTRDVHFEINNEQDFLNWYVDLTRFSTAGFLGSLLAVAIEERLNFMSEGTAYLLVMMWAVYAVYEVTHPCFEQPKDID